MSTSAVHARFAREAARRADCPKLPGWMLDIMAERAMNPQGWRQTKDNVCGSCHTYMSRNGSCLCS